MSLNPVNNVITSGQQLVVLAHSQQEVDATVARVFEVANKKKGFENLQPIEEFRKLEIRSDLKDHDPADWKETANESWRLAGPDDHDYQLMMLKEDDECVPLWNSGKIGVLDSCTYYVQDWRHIVHNVSIMTNNGKFKMISTRIFYGWNVIMNSCLIHKSCCCTASNIRSVGALLSGSRSTPYFVPNDVLRR